MQDARDRELEAHFGEPPDAVAFERTVSLTRASSIEIDRPRWAWKDRIPVGGVTLIPGREGEGKTALVGHLCARWTRGDLPGEREGCPADVIYIGNEDDRATVLVPRLIAAGADLDRFLFVDMPNGGSFSVSIDTEALIAAAEGLDVVAVIVDPLDAHLGVQDSHRKAEVQGAIGRLAVLTQHLRCAGIGIAHFNKGDARDVLRKVVGSVGLTTSVRSVLAVGPHPEQPEAEKVAVLSKANMTDKSAVPAVRFRVEGTTVDHPDGGTVDTARVVMLGEQYGLDPDSILTAAENDDDHRDVVSVLADVLADGPMWAKDVFDAMAGAGFSKDQAKRAKAKLRIVTRKVGKPGDSEQGWQWVLPDPKRADQSGSALTAPSAPFTPLAVLSLPSVNEECEERQGSDESDESTRTPWDNLGGDAA